MLDSRVITPILFTLVDMPAGGWDLTHSYPFYACPVLGWIDVNVVQLCTVYAARVDRPSVTIDTLFIVVSVVLLTRTGTRTLLMYF